MAHVNIHNHRVVLNNPVFVDGLAGLGLVGKLATDHLVEGYEMTRYASVECPGLPSVAAYKRGDYATRPPVRIYADETRNLLALQSDVPVSPQVVGDFAACLTGLLVEHNALPVYVTGRPVETEGPPEDRSLFGVATGGAGRLLEEVGIDPPTEDGVWRGPTGALLETARNRGIDALGLVVEANRQGPDPEAAFAVLERGIAPIAGIEPPADGLRARAAEIRDEEQELADRMLDPAGNESSKAEPLRMYQ